MMFALKNVFRASGHLFSIQRSEVLRTRSSRYWISRVCALTNTGVMLFFKVLVRMVLLSYSYNTINDLFPLLETLGNLPV